MRPQLGSAEQNYGIIRWEDNFLTVPKLQMRDPAYRINRRWSILRAMPAKPPRDTAK